MYHFFIEKHQISDDEGIIVGSDVNHIKNVLRIDVSEEIILCDMEGMDYHCEITSLTNDEIHCKILSKEASKAELPIRVSLYQGAPKQDKLELIIQKNVELGVFDITPVKMMRTIVKYDQKKLKKKVDRWQSIGLSAAKQSKRGIVPKINTMIGFKELLTELASYDKVIIPYENELGISETRRLFKTIEPGQTVAIVIGPEGGFDEKEIEELRSLGGETVTLGNRILRTETAGMACMAMLSYEIEEAK